MTTREQVLKAIEQLGNSVKPRTNPNYWSYEDQHRAEGESRRLDQIRQLYREIRVCAESRIVGILKSAYPHLGPEGNHLRCMVEVLEGRSDSWTITNDGLVFVESRKPTH